jgi:hypothetical protein
VSEKEQIDYLKMAREKRTKLYQAISHKSELIQQLKENEHYINSYAIDMQKYYEEHIRQIKEK